MRPLSHRIAYNIAHMPDWIPWFFYQKSRSENDYLLFTFPSSGTHWVRLMLAKALVMQYDLDYTFDGFVPRDIIPSFSSKKDRFIFYKEKYIPRIQQTHSAYNHLYFRNRKTIILVRDIRDTLVSHYNVLVKKFGYTHSFSDFIRGKGVNKNKHHTIDTRIDLLNSWADGSSSLSSLLVLRYEDLRADTEKEMKKVFDYLGMDVSDETVREVIRFASLDNMKDMELKKDAKAVKISSGIVRNYLKYFDDNDYTYIKDKLAGLKNSFGYEYSVRS